MQFQRQSRRVAVEIPITVTTVLDSLEGTIIDLTEYGAQIIGCGVPGGTRFQIEYMGQTVFARCQWAEVDRMGVKFSFRLSDGPLFDAFTKARASLPNPMPEPAQPASGPRGLGKPLGGFGRRLTA